MDFDQNFAGARFCPIPGDSATGQSPATRPEYEQMQRGDRQARALGAGAPLEPRAGIRQRRAVEKSKKPARRSLPLRRLRRTAAGPGLAVWARPQASRPRSPALGRPSTRNACRARKTAVDALEPPKPLTEEAPAQHADNDALNAKHHLLDETRRFRRHTLEGDAPRVGADKILQGQAQRGAAAPAAGEASSVRRCLCRTPVDGGIAAPDPRAVVSSGMPIS